MAIWGAGALVPTAAEIVSTISGEPLTEEGLVSVQFWVRFGVGYICLY
jgi:hypothetical protein